ncbi:MAG: hypothetical protein FWB91_01615 [Defluviitaleaceae bacterium]|nr:hypothetical protein [Defluviitaleaceae bacterium]
MNTEKKLQYFTEAIAREVEARQRRARHQAANDLSEETASALESAESRAHFQLEATRRKLLREANKKIAAATTGARANFAAKRKSLFERLTAEAAEELESFTRSPEYEDYLIKSIAQAQEERGFADGALLKLHPRDMHFAEKIRQTTGLNATEGDENYIGGFVLESAASRADYTFKTRLLDLTSTVIFF